MSENFDNFFENLSYLFYVVALFERFCDKFNNVIVFLQVILYKQKDF